MEARDFRGLGRAAQEALRRRALFLIEHEGMIPAVGSPDGCPALSLTSGTGPSRVTEAGIRVSGGEALEREPRLERRLRPRLVVRVRVQFLLPRFQARALPQVLGDPDSLAPDRYGPAPR